MFTGIIEDLGIVKAVKKGQLFLLSAESPLFKTERIGESIAVNGVCLTISDLKNNLAIFDIMPETLLRSNLGSLQAGDRVNLERALKVSDRLSGHFVTGHIDCVGKIIGKKNREGNYSLEIKIPKREDMRLIVPKGSVALDGVSLTVAEYVSQDTFLVYLIPHTLKITNLGTKKVGSEVNIEFDLLGKYVLNSLLSGSTNGSGINENFLRRYGLL